MKTITESSPTITLDWHWPLLMAFISLPFILTGSGIAILAYKTAGMRIGIGAGLALVSAVAFPLLNPFVEELCYRGHPLDRQEKSHSAPAFRNWC